MNVTVFGDSIGKGIFTDGGKIEVLQNNAVSLFENWRGIKIDNRSTYGQSLKRLIERGVIDRYIQSLDRTQKRCGFRLEIGGYFPQRTTFSQNARGRIFGFVRGRIAKIPSGRRVAYRLYDSAYQ